MYLPDNNLHYPVLISVGNGGGSGFYIRNDRNVFAVTAKHVLFNSAGNLINQQITLTSVATDNKTKIVLKVDAARLLVDQKLKSHPTADVAVINIGSRTEHISLTNGIQRIGSGPLDAKIVQLPLEGTKVFDEVCISNTAFVFGYPMSLANAQLKPHLPLLRRGIVAGKTEDRKIVIDAPVYFGNSGGLVIEVNEDNATQRAFRGIGIAVQLIPFVEQLHSQQYGKVVGLRHENSGYALVEPIDNVKELMD